MRACHSTVLDEQLLISLRSEAPSPPPLEVQPAGDCTLCQIPVRQLSLHLPGCAMQNRLALWVREEILWPFVGAIPGQAPTSAVHDKRTLPSPTPPRMHSRPCMLHGDRGTVLQLSFHPPGDPYYLCDQSWAGPGVCDASCGRCNYCPVFRTPSCQVNIQVRIISHAGCQRCPLYPALADLFYQVTFLDDCSMSLCNSSPCMQGDCAYQSTGHLSCQDCALTLQRGTAVWTGLAIRQWLQHQAADVPHFVSRPCNHSCSKAMQVGLIWQLGSGYSTKLQMFLTSPQPISMINTGVVTHALDKLCRSAQSGRRAAATAPSCRCTSPRRRPTPQLTLPTPSQ